MRRREFIAGFGSAAAWPVVARAQQSVVPVVGYLDAGASEARRHYAVAFSRGLSEAGYTEGRNVAIEYRWAENRFDQLPSIAAEFVRRNVAVIVALTTPSATAAKNATATIPIVFSIGADPIKFGLVSSFNRPGANVTGFSGVTNALGAKNLEFLHELLPRATVIAMLVNPANPNAGFDTADAQIAARKLGLRLLVLNGANQTDIGAAFTTMVEQRASALLVSSDASFLSNSNQLIELSARHRIPAIYDRREFPLAGGLMSYETSRIDALRQIGMYVGRILRGEKPADLPVMQPTKFELMINLKTAKALGLTIPETLLATADEVIQ
jgi:putative ABC transport system substrate-binding protein